MMLPTDQPLWYKNAIIYQLHVKSFFDANDDGIGDFPGLMRKLDHLRELGVSALWLLPFYPSPLRDDGYDIADYRGINPTYGTMRDFRAFVRAAHERGLKVITELVINHTSDQHPWFQRAREAPRGSRWRNWYVWSDDDKRWSDTRIIFTDTESSNWTWDPVAGQYYWHRFFAHQPDLNFDNPQVVKATIDTMRFWLDMGVDGLRLDAIPYLVERDGTSNENLDETHAVIKQLRAAMDDSHPHAFFLAEANQWPEDTRAYFGEGDECHMAFHFPLMPRMYMAMAQEDRHPITDIMRQTPEIPGNCQWAIFLRNHDELTLEMVTERERDYLWRFYAADQRARINLGIRRRLAPLMDNDRRKIELMNSLLFSMPGTPIIYYGDEIGMGDNFFLGDRDGVRTPMQWSPDRNAGFSKADPARLYLPAIMDPVYGFDSVNVEAQARSAASLLNWMRRIIGVRQRHTAFGSGGLTFLYPGNRKILAYLREDQPAAGEGEGAAGEAILCVANLSRQAQAVELDLARFKGRVPIEMLGGSRFPPIGEMTYLLTLPAYGFYWFLLSEDEELPSWHEALPEALPDLVTVVWSRGWAGLTDGQTASLLASEALPAFVPNQRWFAGKAHRLAGARMVDGVRLRPGDGGFYLGLVETSFADGVPAQRYALPLGVLWDELAVTTLSPTLPYTLAKVRRGPRLGALIDATIDTGFAPAVLEHVRRNLRIETAAGGELRFTAGSGLAAVEVGEEDEIRRLGVEQSNTSILIGDKLVMKLYRKLSPGAHPELEIGRFLTEIAGFEHVPPLLGEIEHFDDQGRPTAVAVLQGFVRNQGDGWTHAQDYLQRELEEAMLSGEDLEDAGARFAVYEELAFTLGQRTAELHHALSLTTGDPGFDPEPLTAADLAEVVDGVRAKAAEARAALARAADAGEAAALLARWPEVEAMIEDFAGLAIAAAKTRHHGDYHLGQVLVTKTDFVLVDFEGEPDRGLEERRAKRSPLRDVAGMIRSFDYAAAAALRRADETDDDRLARRGALTALWRTLAVEAFLAAYRQTIAGCVGYPQDPAQAAALLDLLTLEKALYEIVYEAGNRPAWIDIPIEGTRTLIDGRRTDAAASA